MFDLPWTLQERVLLQINLSQDYVNSTFAHKKCKSFNSGMKNIDRLLKNMVQEIAFV